MSYSTTVTEVYCSIEKNENDFAIINTFLFRKKIDYTKLHPSLYRTLFIVWNTF